MCRMDLRYRVQNPFVNLMRHNSHLISEHTQAKMSQRPSAATSTIGAKVGRAEFKFSYYYLEAMISMLMYHILTHLNNPLKLLFPPKNSFN